MPKLQYETFWAQEATLMDFLTREEQALVEQTMKVLHSHHKEYLLLKQLLGFRIDQMTDEGVTVSIPIHEGISNGRNMVHGGVTAALADAAMGVLAAKLVGDEQSAVTSNLYISYIAAGRGKQLTARVKAAHIGKKSMVFDCFIINDLEKLIAKAEATYFIVPKGY
ncbi:PaaI family thioesterase [Sporolactobacillus sp. KGMB 08714]|uniref:PaaI family thioesterase n=1 Tax=Sporolactobacillus sp. KGMB 08714 TaxID=3064704 RepID=UPI002FBDD37B